MKDNSGHTIKYHRFVYGGQDARDFMDAADGYTEDACQLAIMQAEEDARWYHIPQTWECHYNYDTGKFIVKQWYRVGVVA